MPEKLECARFFIESGAFRGEDTVLKSGRLSPYFFNTGIFDDGEKILRLGEYYADALLEHFNAAGFDVVFGPAYKGIPLAVAISIAIHQKYGITKRFSFNRKEAKTHGEKGSLLGHQIQDGENIVLIDDVMTTGGTKYEALSFIKRVAPEASVKGLVIALDRQEIDDKGENAIQGFTSETGVPVFPLLTIRELLQVSPPELIKPSLKERIGDYLTKYGVKYYERTNRA